MNITNEKVLYEWDEVVYNPQSTFGPRRQEHYQLVLVHQGGADIEVDGETVTVKAGQVVLLMPEREEFFRFSPAEPTHHSWIHAQFPGSTPLWPSLLEKHSIVLPIGRRLQWIIRELLAAGNTVEGIQRGFCHGLASSAFYDVFLRAGIRIEEPVPRHPAVERALTVLKKDYRESLTLGGIAIRCGLSPQHLSRIFEDALGLTPIRFLWRIREDEGRRLLRETGLTVAEIAEVCGFQNPFHFTRRMGARFGKPPRQLRKGDWRRGPDQSRSA